MIYTIATQKGGTGKTTTAAILSQAATYRGKSTLAVDLDPQGNLTYALNADPEDAGSYELLNGMIITDTIQSSPQGMDVISASLNLQTVTTDRGSARRLADALEMMQNYYEYIIVDTPPTMGELHYNALQAADVIIMPLLADTFNVQSIYQNIGAITQIMQTNARLQDIYGIITRYEGNSNADKFNRETIIDIMQAQDIKYLGTVRKAIAAHEAVMFQQSLYEYAPKCKPAIDYLQIFDQLDKNN